MPRCCELPAAAAQPDNVTCLAAKFATRSDRRGASPRPSQTPLRLRELPTAAAQPDGENTPTVRYLDSLYEFSERAITDRPYNASPIPTKYPYHTKNIYYLLCIISDLLSKKH